MFFITLPLKSLVALIWSNLSAIAPTEPANDGDRDLAARGRAIYRFVK